MEAREETTARLVLGYLRSVGCLKAYNEFLKSSVHLLPYTDDNVKSKYIPTRYNGLSLDNILKDYFECSQTVQGRLEITNYFNEVHPEVSLEKQLTYLLNRVENNPTPTPVHSVVLDSSDSDGDSSCVEVCNNPEGAPSSSPSDTSDRFPHTQPKSGGDIAKNIFRDALLENSEFQERMAETINNTRQIDTQQFDLNETIKSVVVQTEKDPVFKQIMDEMMDTVNNLSGGNGLSMDSEESSNEKCYHRKRRGQVKKLSPGKHAETQTEINYSTSEKASCSRNISKYVVSSTITPPSQLYIDSMGNLVMVPPTIPTTGITYPSSQYYLINQKSDDCTSGIKDINILPLSTVLPNEAGKPELSGSAKLKQQIVATDVSKSKLPLEICCPSIRNRCAPPSAVKEFLNLGPTTSTPKSAVDAKHKNVTKMDKLKNMCNFVNKSKAEQGLEHENVLKTKPSELKTISGGIETHSNATKQVIDKSKRSDPGKINSSSRDIPGQDFKKLPLLVPKLSSSSMIKSDDDQSKRKTFLITPLQRNPLKKATPKSTSHVRNLDFSTPQKKPATQTNVIENKSKIQATKALFKPDKSNVKRPWDADLRVCLEPLKKEMMSTKRKRKSAGDKTVLTKKSKVVIKEKKCKSNVDAPHEENVAVIQEENEEMLEKKKDEALSKIILSPSKYNANKRALVGESDQTTPQISEQQNEPQFTAVYKPSFAVETPVKGYIKTPGATTPAEATPFTKMLEANITTMNINNITTPSIPFTPDFPPLTPTVDLLTPYPNRPTDYSTGSSYYQPSDNEITKSLEKQMRKMEKSPQPKLPMLNEAINKFLQLLSSDSEEELSETRCKLYNGRTGPNVIKKTLQEESVTLSKCKPAPIEKRTTRQSARRGNVVNEEKSLDKIAKVPAKKKSYPKTKRNTSSKKKTPNKPTDSKTDVAQSAITIESDNAISKPNPCQIKPTEEQVLMIPDIEAPKEKKLRSASKTKLAKVNSDPHLSEVKPMQKEKVITLDKKEPERLETQSIIKAQEDNQTVGPNTSKIEPTQGDFSKHKLAMPAEKECEEEKLDTLPIENRSFKRRAEILPAKNIEKNWFLKLFSGDLNQSQSTGEDNNDKNPIPWLKQRGIHLVENKAKKEQEVKGKINISDVSKEIIYSTRHTLDTQTFEEPDVCFVYDESARGIEGEKPAVQFERFSVSTAEIYMEELDADVEITLIHSHFFSLIEIPAEDFMEADLPPDCLDNGNEFNGNDNHEEDDMSLEEETANGLNTYEGIKDRSIQAKSLLQGLNLDTFLDNIHGNSSSEC